MRLLSRLAWFVLVVSGFACRSDATVQITERASGRIVRLRRGEALVVTLASNRTTGYRWIATVRVPSILAQTGPPKYIQPKSRLLGASGQEVWRFLAVRPGGGRLGFDYRRPWERSGPAAQTVRYLIAVHG